MLNTGCCSSLMGCKASLDGAAGRRPRTRNYTRRAGAALAREQRVELARVLELGEVVVAADVGVADVDLRHRAPAGLAHHLVALPRVDVDPDLLDLAHAFRLEQHLGANAIGADAGRVHGDL